MNCPKCGEEMDVDLVQVGTAPRAHDVWADICSFCDLALDANGDVIEL